MGIDLQTLMSIIPLIVSLASAIVMIIKDRRSAPIERKTADVASFTSLSNASKVNVDMALALADRLADENERYLNTISEQDKKIIGWQHWYNVLRTDWELLKANDVPPDSPCFKEEDK